MENTEKSFLIRTFGRTRGKKLSARQNWLIERLLPALIPDCKSPISQNSGNILEIGFGAGEHMLHLARENPDSCVLGAEPYMNGVASLLSQMTDGGGCVRPEYRNIRIWPNDVRKLLGNQAPRGAGLRFAKIYILHPDPRPKARHEKRRLLSSEFLEMLAGRLSADGQIIIGTDHADYFGWLLAQISKTSLKIRNPGPCLPDSKARCGFAAPPESGLDTRYKNKDLFGANRPQYIVLERGPRLHPPLPRRIAD